MPSVKKGHLVFTSFNPSEARHILGTPGEVILVPPAREVLDIFWRIFIQETGRGKGASGAGGPFPTDCQFIDIAPVVSGNIGPQILNILVGFYNGMADLSTVGGRVGWGRRIG